MKKLGEFIANKKGQVMIKDFESIKQASEKNYNNLRDENQYIAKHVNKNEVFAAYIDAQRLSMDEINIFEGHNKDTKLGTAKDVYYIDKSMSRTRFGLPANNVEIVYNQTGQPTKTSATRESTLNFKLNEARKHKEGGENYTQTTYHRCMFVQPKERSNA